MKVTLDLPDPKFKVGDVVRWMIGWDRDVPVVFAVCGWHFAGTWMHSSAIGTVVDSMGLYGDRDSYTLAAQEDIFSKNGSEWIHKRMVFCPEIYDLEENAEKIEWDKPILPAADTEFYREKWYGKKKE